MSGEHPSVFYRAVFCAVQRIYPKITLTGTEQFPAGPVIAVGNHAQTHGPIIAELYYPRPRMIWCAGEMLHLREIPDYSYRDFWSRKSPRVRWLYRILSYLIAPIAALIFHHADVIAVYHDRRILSTFRETLSQLEQGRDIIIFPEQDAPRNHILCAFQERFVDVAQMYYRKTGKVLSFVPMYLAPELRSVHFGTPIRFRPDAPLREERHRICEELAREITRLAESLPPHTVIPYNNIPRKDYPTNRLQEVLSHEKTSC